MSYVSQFGVMQGEDEKRGTRWYVVDENGDPVKGMPDWANTEKGREMACRALGEHLASEAASSQGEVGVRIVLENKPGLREYAGPKFAKSLDSLFGDTSEE